MKKILQSIGAILATLVLSTGVYVSAQTGSIDTTGPDSTNEITHNSEADVNVNNTTAVDANVDVDQDADSGNATTRHNTEAGDAESGEAANDSSVEATLDIDNSGTDALAGLGDCMCADSDGSISKTGPDSTNTVSFTNSLNVQQNNTVSVSFDTNVDQDADSGNAEVNDNTTGGSATSGAASNTSSTVFSLSVHN